VAQTTTKNTCTTTAGVFFIIIVCMGDRHRKVIGGVCGENVISGVCVCVCVFYTHAHAHTHITYGHFFPPQIIIPFCAHLLCSSKVWVVVVLPPSVCYIFIIRVRVVCTMLCTITKREKERATRTEPLASLSLSPFSPFFSPSSGGKKNKVVETARMAHTCTHTHILYIYMCVCVCVSYVCRST
jgi:hypothetical protein